MTSGFRQSRSSYGNSSDRSCCCRRRHHHNVADYGYLQCAGQERTALQGFIAPRPTKGLSMEHRLEHARLWWLFRLCCPQRHQNVPIIALSATNDLLGVYRVSPSASRVSVSPISCPVLRCKPCMTLQRNTLACNKASYVF